MLFDRAKRLDAVAGLADTSIAVELAEQKAELIARELFVVDHERAKRVGRLHRLRRVIFGGHHELGNDDACARAFAGDAIELQLVIGAVDHAQAFVDVAQTDAARR